MRSNLITRLGLVFFIVFILFDDSSIYARNQVRRSRSSRSTSSTTKQRTRSRLSGRGNRRGGLVNRGAPPSPSRPGRGRGADKNEAKAAENQKLPDVNPNECEDQKEIFFDAFCSSKSPTDIGKYGHCRSANLLDIEQNFRSFLKQRSSEDKNLEELCSSKILSLVKNMKQQSENEGPVEALANQKIKQIQAQGQIQRAVKTQQNLNTMPMQARSMNQLQQIPQQNGYVQRNNQAQMMPRRINNNSMGGFNVGTGSINMDSGGSLRDFRKKLEMKSKMEEQQRKQEKAQKKEINALKNAIITYRENLNKLKMIYNQCNVINKKNLAAVRNLTIATTAASGVGTVSSTVGAVKGGMGMKKEEGDED